MQNKSQLIKGQIISDVMLTLIDEHIDVRGSFSEIFRNQWETSINPVQWSMVKSDENVLRGMHLHLRHDEYFCLIKGHCLVALKDIRPNSPSNGFFSIYELFESDLAALTFPRGLIHGWYFFKESIHIQAVSESYSDYGKDDNWSVNWNAEDLAIPWPDIKPLVFKKPSEFQSLNNLIKTIHDFK
jgi:dTDP-4-dehydrorhamnose 3,5-epimerase